MIGLVEEMIQLFVDEQLVAFDSNNKKLDMEKWKEWPMDIYWIKQSILALKKF
jgi:hypothetical protein